MDISIQSRHVDLADGVREAARLKVSKMERFLDGIDRAEVRFSEERNPRIADKDACEVTVHAHGHVVRARASAHDPHAALDLVLDKLEHQLTKLKKRLVDRKHPRHGAPHNDASLVTALPPDEAGFIESLAIVRTKRFAIEAVDPAEAALQMDLVGHAFYFFTNSETGRPAVVYRRGDGQVGLIDSE